MDFGVELDGYYGDAALTVPVGKIRPEREKLLRVTRESLERAIEQVRPGNRLGDISAAVQEWVEQQRLFGGARVRGPRHRHQDARGSASAELRRPGPRPAAAGRHGAGHRADGEYGRPGRRVLEDKWTAVTEDGSDSAHFEHTVAVTANGPWILTRPSEATGPSGEVR